MSPCVSVIVPIYNREAQLVRCLDSLHAQTLDNIEIIMVDDGSTDNSIPIAQSYAENCPQRFRHILLPGNQGTGAARNAGLETAQGEYIAFVDSDDCVEADMFRQLYDSAHALDVDILIFGAKIITAHTVETVYAEADTSLESLRKAPLLFACVWTKIFKKAFLQKNVLLFPTSSLAEDLAFVIKALAQSPRLGSVAQTPYHYYRHEANVTLDIRKRKDSLRSMADIKSYLTTQKLWDKYRKLYHRLCWEHLVYHPLCLIFIDALCKGHNRWHNLRYAPAYFYDLLRFWVRN